MPERGEVWQVDFGITQKVRPALVISIPYADTDRALIGVIPHTSATRGSQFEVSVPVSFLDDGAFLAQGIQALPPKYFLRRLGVLPRDQLHRVEEVLHRWQGFRARWPKAEQLAERIVESLDFAETDEIQKLWVAEAIRRRDEIRSGRVQPIPGEQVLAEVRRLVGR